MPVFLPPPPSQEDAESPPMPRGAKAPPPTPTVVGRVDKPETGMSEAVRVALESMGVSELKQPEYDVDALQRAGHAVLEAVRKEQARLYAEVQASEWVIVETAESLQRAKKTSA